MKLGQLLVRQFHRPRGLLGRAAGWIMATRRSNLERNRWTVDLLDVRPGDRVLELGPGPGVTLGLLLERAGPGKVTAVDHSPLMVEACRRRHRGPVEAGRLELRLAAFPGMPADAVFDRIIAVNALQFDAMSVDALREIGRHLAPGGHIAVTFQPRGRGVTDRAALDFGQRASRLLEAAGLTDARIETLPLKPVCAVCVLARRPVGQGSITP